MMRGGQMHRLWLLGGALSAIALFAVGWFFFIGPQYAEAAAIETQTEAANDRVAALQKRLAKLRRENADFATYQADLARNRQALPTADAGADLLRQLQKAGEASGVTVTGITVGGATDVTAADTTVQALPISLTATGAAPRLGEFLNQLQLVQPRAVLINSINLATAADSGAKVGTTTMSINLQAFYASTN